ncbi:dTMP kinase [Candidatus Magnetaquicoccus inordinatus]|uniref:dTMP kinase n=1 Tax=Candidatus Magnetaquicoccus inordinatus TaxID=2496818 RepID=UPI00102D1436|nr:dTMP kinase [Candidatus Magnetaquicoccus inordinatus]
MSTFSHTGRFLSFEGGDGAGKSLQQRMLAQRLRELDIPVLSTREPGGSPLAEEIRHLLLAADSMRSPETELLLLLAARSDHLQQRILPTLQQGVWVLCDRFLESTLAYQGYGKGMDLSWLYQCHQQFCAALLPDRTLLLDVDPTLGLQRSRNSRPPDEPLDYFEQQQLAFHQRVRDGFLHMASQQPQRIRRIDASQTIDAVAERIWEEIRVLLPHS